MLIALYRSMVSRVLPVVEVEMKGLAGTIAVVIIILIGVRIGLTQAGVHFSGRTTGMIIGAIVKEIGFLFEKLIEASGWFLRKIIEAIPKVYSNSKKFFKGMGMASAFASIFAFLVTTLFIAIII